MVFFNYATMQMAAKIVYYGPGLCGKTTNLHTIYGKTSPQSRGEMVSLETETDRTLFFDLLPLDVGVVGGFKTRLQLYTVPGQVFYNTTRKLVLKGVDGIVFVADSQRPMLEANVESLKNLRENLAEIGLVLDELPLVIQLNKRDLPNVLPREDLVSALDPEGKYEFVEASAVTGMGVFETLKLISKLTLKSLRRRMTGDEPPKPAARRAPSMSAAPPPSKSGAVFTVHGSQSSPASPATAPAAASRTIEAPLPPASAPAAAAEAQPHHVATTAVAEPLPQPVVQPVPPPLEQPAPPAVEERLEQPQEEEPVETTGAPIEETPQEKISSAEAAPVEEPVVEELPPAAAPASEPEAEYAEAPEPEVTFAEVTEKPAKPVEAEVKHVKVRNTNDIMAELDLLRKKATSSPGKGKVDVLSALDALTSNKPKKDSLTKTASVRVANDTPKKSRVARVTITFEDDTAGVVQQTEQRIEIDNSDWSALQLSIKVERES